MRTEIIYEDKSILVCHKPSGIAVQTSKVGEMDVVSELKNYLAAKKGEYRGYLGIVHRLDQPVEGLLVFAKTKDAAAKLTRQLQDGTLNKDYLAVVCYGGEEGFPEADFPMEGTLVDEIAKSPGNRAVIRDLAGMNEQGPDKYGAWKTEKQDQELIFKKAVLHYKMTNMSHIELKECSLFLAEIHIETGRFHQIRAQMSHAGFPILGDYKYGNDISVMLSKDLNLHTILLCADRISFSHPVTSKIMEFKICPAHSLFKAASQKV